ncbi:Transport and Golgi organization 1-like 1 [Homarus americanus]|uniref:Transport and Golgi organization 1-like 1 n=1 Tax=Homarus americanus TaxID=6706 RepID=A0A8J5N762_HOMAM|nr:Transport and Golgi organization 1-like 1 [Homarus americanus]
MTSGSLVFLGIVVFTIITIYFVHLIMMKFSRESPMLEALSRTEHENRLKAEENATLHEELCKARAELEIVSSSFMASSGDITELDSQLDIIKSEYGIERSQLEERIVQLEHELEETTSNGLEMHKMLSEMLSAQKDTSTFQASVDHLQAMLDGQREKVETLTSDLALKTRLNEELHSELSASMERTKKLDYQVQQLTQSLQELTGSQEEANHRLQKETVLVKELKEANEALSQQTCDYDSKMSSLNSELKALQDTIHQLRESVEIKESELQVAKECLKQLRLTSDDDHAAPDEEKLSALFNVIRVKAELQRVNNERNDLAEQLTDAEMAQTNLEDAMSSIRSEVTELRTHHDLAIQEKREALSKLAVLSQYFEEKEAQLTKELESQEGLRLNAEGSAASVSKKIQNYGLELASYKRIKRHVGLAGVKSRKVPPMPEHVSLSDLSPTTGNVPMSDEYKVEWVRAKAELKRRKSSASSTDRSDKIDKAFTTSTASNLQSSDSSHHSSDFPHCPSESSTRSTESPLNRQLIKMSKVHSQNIFQKSVTHEPVYPARPSSLSVAPTPCPVYSAHQVEAPSPIITHNPLHSQPSSNVPVSHTPNLIINKEASRSDCGLEIANIHLQRGDLNLSDSMGEDLQETTASDDVKSSAAAMRSMYKTGHQVIKKEKLMTLDSEIQSLPKSKPVLKKKETLKTPSFRIPVLSHISKTGPKKTQVDSLRKELEDQENSYKVQIASQEQKAHENWLQARTAERKHEEQRQENSQLRNRLTLLQKEKEAQQLQVNIIKPTPKRIDANGSLSSPGLILDGVVDGDHSGLTSLHRDVDSPPVPPHPLHGPPPILPMMFPPGGPLPPGVPPPHGLPPGVHPPPGLPHGVPPPHGLPPHPFLAGEPPFMGPLPPLPGDRRLPPAGGMSSPPFRRSGSPTYDHRHDRYSPVSDRSHFSERRFSPPLRHRLPSPELHRNRSPDRRCDRTRSPDRRSDRMRSSPDHHTNRRTPDRRLDRRSPDRHFSTRSPDGYIRHRTSPQHYFDQPDYNNDDPRLRPPHIKGMLK